MRTNAAQLKRLTRKRPRPHKRIKGSYSAYLFTPHWRAMRKRALRHYGEHCARCETSADLCVHHRTYERVGHERLSDLVVLCADCHTDCHAFAASHRTLTLADATDQFLQQQRTTIRAVRVVKKC